jgi:hypothetical protein
LLVVEEPREIEGICPFRASIIVAGIPDEPKTLLNCGFRSLSSHRIVDDPSKWNVQLVREFVTRICFHIIFRIKEGQVSSSESIEDLIVLLKYSIVGTHFYILRAIIVIFD